MDVICLLDLFLSNYLFLTIYLVSPVLSTIPHPSAAGGVDYFSDAYSFPSSGGPSSSYDSYSEDSKWQQELKDHSHIDQIRSRILRHNTLPHNRKMPVDVSVKLVFESVREIGVDATIDFYVEFVWSDEREGGRDVYISGSDSRDYAWTPDIYFLLSRHTDYSRTSQYLIISNGTVLFDQKVTVTVPCVPNAFMYPFDTIYCSVLLSSYGYSNKYINLHWANEHSILFPKEYLDVEYTGFTMQLNDTSQSQYDAFYDPSTYTILQGQIYFRRLYSVYVYQLFLPAAFLVGLSWITFWINPQATPARAAIGVTTILTMLTLNTNRQQDRHSKYLNIKMSLLDIYLWACFIYVILAMVAFSASDYSLAFRNSSSRRNNQNTTTRAPPTNPQTRITPTRDSRGTASAGVGGGSTTLYHKTGVILPPSPTLNSQGGAGNRKLDHHGVEIYRKVFLGRGIDFHARIMFPLTFFLFNCVFWCYAFAKS